jgi:hypothetical protein
MMDDDVEIPNTVHEFTDKLNMYYAKMNEAEEIYMYDNGASYHKAIEDRDNYILNTKKAWYNSLSEAEKNNNHRRYEILQKMIEDAGLYKYAKGGMMAKGGKTEKKKFTSYTILDADEYGNRDSSSKKKATKFYIVWYGNAYQLFMDKPHTINNRAIFDNDDELKKGLKMLNII